VLTRYLSPFDYGIVETFMTVVACLTGVVIIGGNALISREYFGLDESERREFAGNILGMILFATVSLLFLYFFSIMWGNFWVNILKLRNSLIILAIVVSAGNAFIAMMSITFQLEKKAASFAVFMNSKTFFEIGLSLFLIIGMGWTWMGRITGISSSIFLFCGIAVYLFKSRNIYILFPAKYWKKICLLGSPLILSHIGGWVYGMIDKIMINNLVNVEATGLYSVGYRFGMVVMMVETAFSLAWLPFFYENISRNKHEHDVKIIKATYIYIGLLFIFSVAFSLLGKHLLYFMVDKRFFGAGQFIFLISLAYFFDGVWKMFVGYLIYKGKTKTHAYIVLFSAAINIILNYILLKQIGLIGAAWATLVSFVVGAVLTIIISVRSYAMPWFPTKPVEG